MPRGDKTGPQGMGPMTGRGAGFCRGFQVPGFMNSVHRRGFGCGNGFSNGNGFGWRNRTFSGANQGWGFQQSDSFSSNEAGQNMTKEQELNVLKEQARYVEESLTNIRKRISEVESADN
ncbi:MAG: DUF5320 domain-containing protein [Deltaproteobacteria bacterium]|nr:DUF5320 domain-containing protein [Deltaproteobacteria bacterium]